MERYPYYPPDFMRAEQTMNINHTPPVDNCKLPLAQATIGIQKWQDVYECDKALVRGTIFEQLDKPFRGSSR